ncbi:MAG: hypothetical protein MHM6MM_002233 [Cercozoa sp. M6MM]
MSDFYRLLQIIFSQEASLANREMRVLRVLSERPVVPTEPCRYHDGSADTSTCTECPAGYSCSISESLPCIAVFDMPRRQGAKCDSSYCAAGTYNAYYGQSSVSACLNCPRGHVCAAAGTSTPSPCPQGYYCPTSTSTPTACPAGRYSAEEQLTDSTECSECPEGNYCTGGAATPSLCARGRYMSTTGATAAGDCVQCVAGYACPSTGMISGTTVPCDPGHYCPTGTSDPDDNPCPAGRYTDRTDLVQLSDCQLCPARSACPNTGTGGSAEPWQACAQGYYCVEGTASPTTNPCPSGTYSNRTDLASASECETCPAGSFCSGATVTPTSCTAGSYCPRGSSGVTQCPNRSARRVLLAVSVPLGAPLPPHASQEPISHNKAKRRVTRALLVTGVPPPV